MIDNNAVHNHSQAKFQADDLKLLSKQRAEELENQFKQNILELPPGFFFSDDKLMYLPEAKPTDKNNPSPIFICSKLEVKAFIRDDNNENYGKLLVFKDPEQQIHE